MSENKNLLKKVLSISLCALMLGGSTVTLPSAVPGGIRGITAAAAENETPAESFEYSENNDGGITINSFIGDEIEVVIPAEINGKPVTKINSYAFYNKSLISSIVIPDSVNDIEDGAFCSCTQLMSINIPDGITGIPDWMFASCISLVTVDIPDSVKSIGNSAFSYCSALENITIPDGAEAIGQSAFEQCISLTDISIPDSVDFIGDSAFKGCSSLKSISLPSGLTSVENKLFYFCTALENVYIPQGVTSIGRYVFQNCSSLKSIILPDSVTCIDDASFMDCSELISVIIPSKVTWLGTQAFSSCSKLQSVSLPNSLTKIYSGTFSNCTELSSVNIPESVTSIDAYAFYNCKKLYSVFIPESVNEISEYAFGYYYDSENQNHKKFDRFTINGIKGSAAETYADNNQIPFNNILKYTSGDYEYEIADNNSAAITAYLGNNTTVKVPSEIDDLPVTWIRQNAFADNKTVENVIIPEGVITVGHQVFMGCENLKSVQFPDTLKILGSGVFTDCSSIVEITVPDSVEEMGIGLFKGCSSLKKVTLPNYAVSPFMYSGCSSLEYAPLSTEGVPEGVHPVIPHKVFEGCTSLREVTIPEDVEKIFEGAFKDCINLEKVVFPGNTEIIDGTEVGDYNVFYNCPKLTIYGHEGSNAQKYAEKHNIPFVSVYDEKYYGDFLYNENNNGEIKILAYYGNDKEVSVPAVIDGKNVTSIGYRHVNSRVIGAFFGNTTIEKVTLPDSITEIASTAFAGCENLKYVNIPDSVSTIEGGAFAGTALEQIVIPGSVDLIPDHCFTGCPLTNVTLKNGIKTINHTAFWNCNMLKEIDIPASVENVNDYALANCDSLSKITFRNPNMNISSEIFEDGEGNTVTGVSVFGYADSTAEAFASQKNYRFILLSEGGVLKNSSTISSETAELGNSVTLTAKATGGYPDYTYTFRCKKSDASSWKYLAANTTTATLNYKPASAGTYDIQVLIKDSKGTVCTKGFKLSVTEPLKNNSTISSTSTTAGVAVTLNAKAAGGKAPYTYTYRCRKSGTSAWTYLGKTNVTATSYSFTPAEAGTYTLQVLVKDSDKTVVSKGFTLYVASNALKNNSTISTTNTTVGTAVKLSADATGGKAPYTFTYRCKKSDASSWKYLAANTANTSLSFKPSSSGTYDIQILVKDADGKVVNKAFKLSVTEPLTNNSSINSTSITSGSAVILSADATGGKAPYTFTYRCKKSDASSWKYLAANTTNTTLSFKPSSSGTYDIQILVKDSDGKVVTKGFKLNVTE